MSNPSVFSGRMLIGWVAAAMVTFAASLYFMTREDNGATSSDAVGPSSFSRSAIGHAGLAETLRRLGVSVVKSKFNSREKLGDGSLLVIAEPRSAIVSQDSVATLLNAKTVLLVLPKWQGTASDQHAGWLGYADLLPTSAAGEVLNLAVAQATVARRPAVDAWGTNELGETPQPTSPVQLMRSGQLRPIVADGEDILVGEIAERGRRLWVLADPDVIENHGLAEGANAAFAVALIDALRGPEGSVVFDETVHGYVARPANPLKLLFEFPFVVTTAQGLVAVALLLWATMGRFGSPETAPPALGSGKQGLIENAAKLLGFAGHQQRMVRRYVQATIRDAARQLHAPRGLSDTALLEWLRRVGEARNADIDCLAVYRETDAIVETRRGGIAPLIPIARDIHKWKREILDGPSGSSRDRGGRAGRSAEGRRRAG
jgi:hypothetical protein